jgi:hypothetical protein
MPTVCQLSEARSSTCNTEKRQTKRNEKEVAIMAVFIVGGDGGGGLWSYKITPFPHLSD